MIYDLITFFNKYHFYEITAKLIDIISLKSGIKYQLEETKISLFKKDYKKVIKITNEIISHDKTQADAYILCGDAYYYQSNLYDSEEAYVKAVRYRPTQLNHYMLYRLGMTYIKRKSWEDAAVVLKKLIKESYGFAWSYLGLAYTRLEQYDKAEEALNQANLLDIDNPDNWGYLTLFCLLTDRKPQALECLNELRKATYDDTGILAEIANLFYKNYGNNTFIIICR